MSTRASLPPGTLSWVLALCAAAGVTVSLSSTTSGFMAARGRSFAAFQRDVAPVLAATCSGRDGNGRAICHGRPNEGSETAESEARVPKLPHLAPPSTSCTKACHAKTGKMGFVFPLGRDGQFENDRQLYLAYEKARALASYDGPRFAKILRMPLASQAGGFGLLHGGGEIFESASDPGFEKLSAWVALEGASSRAKTAEVSPAEKAYGEKVLPALARNMCLSPSCHIFNHSSFVPDPGMPSDDLSAPLESRFSREQVSFNRMTSKGMIQRLVFLEGRIEESRILRKIIPIDQGGVLHRGGNRQFLTGPEDPDFKAIAEWLRLERLEATSKVKIDGTPVLESELGRVRGVIFVRTPASNVRKYLDVGKYLPGGDLFALSLLPGETLETATSEPINLTAELHPGREADVREPDVRYDGRAVVFAMRVGEEDGLNLYELELDEQLRPVRDSVRRLTFGAPAVSGVQIHYTDPTYVPDPTDQNAGDGGFELSKADLVFVSNLPGELVKSAPRAILGEADGGDEATIVDFDRPERSGMFVGRRVHVVDGANRGEWRTIVGHENRTGTAEGRAVLKVDRPFPRPVDVSTIYTIERPATPDDVLPAYSVYGMKLGPRGREQEHYDGTLTRITWNGGQNLDLSVRSNGEVFFTSQRSGVDKLGRPVFQMASCRRHLDTRFSFPTHQGNRSEVLVYADNHELPSGIDIHAALDPDTYFEAGTLTVSDHQLGPDLEARNPNDYATGVFDESGLPTGLERDDSSNLRFTEKGRAPSLTRFLFKNTALFPARGPDAVTRTGESPGGLYRDPHPLPDGSVLVSHAAGPVDQLDPAERPDFDLFVLRPDPSWQPEGGRGTPRVSKRVVRAASRRGLIEVQAVPVVARLKPKVNAGNRPKSEHLIRYLGSPVDTRPARYTERSYPVIDAVLRDPSPFGKHLAIDRDPVTGERLGELDRVAGVRMVEMVPLKRELLGPVDPSRVRNGDPESTLVANGITPQKRVVGQVPLEADGSISVKVPSNTPLVIQSLNSVGMALRQEARYYFFAPNEPFTISPSPSETFQTCGACMGAVSGHPKDLFGPANAFSGQANVDALAKDQIPELGLRVEARYGVDFERDLLPVIRKKCESCHGGERPAAGLSLGSGRTAYFVDAYESLMALEDPASAWYGRKKYVSERDGLAIESYLAEKLWGRELKAERRLAGDAPHPSPSAFEAAGLKPEPLTDAELKLFTLWMDLGAPFLGPPGSTPKVCFGGPP
ncbi:MAG: hypothetical protein HYV07_12245 [Deltaproteobacteria bacterium]|nr:hypothetical protein [Deltaproteobacteria bacterium]